MKNINVNEENIKKTFDGKKLVKKAIAVICIAGVVPTFAACKNTEVKTSDENTTSYADKLAELDKIYLVPYADDIYVMASEELDYDKSFKINSYNEMTQYGKLFTIELDDGNIVVWNTEDVIEIPVSKEGLETADMILTNSGQGAISPYFRNGKTKTK